MIKQHTHLLVGLCSALVAMLTLPVAATASSTFCPDSQVPVFTPGFAALRVPLGPRMGSPIECEHHDPSSSDQIIQHTTTGLNVYQLSTNLFAFTDGYQWWSLTNGQFQYWTQDLTTNKASPSQVRFQT